MTIIQLRHIKAQVNRIALREKQFIMDSLYTGS